MLISNKANQACGLNIAILGSAQYKFTYPRCVVQLLSGNLNKLSFEDEKSFEVEK